MQGHVNVEEMIEEIFTVDYDEQQGGIKKPTKNMVEGASIDIVKRACLDTIFVCIMDKVAEVAWIVTLLRDESWEIRPVLRQSQTLSKSILTPC